MPDLADGIKVAVALAGIAGYGAYKLGWLERTAPSRPGSRVRFRPRPALAPRKVVFEKALLDICPIDSLSLIRTTAKLRNLGFVIVSDFEIKALPASWFRAFVHGSEPLYAVFAEHSTKGRPPLHLDFISVLEDQSYLITSNSEEPSDDRRPKPVRLVLETGLLPEELYVRHNSLLKDLKNAPLAASRLAFFDHYRQLLVADSVLRGSGRPPGRNTLQKTLDTLGPIDTITLLRRFAFAPSNHPSQSPLAAASAESSTDVAGATDPDRTIETSARSIQSAVKSDR